MTTELNTERAQFFEFISLWQKALCILGISRLDIGHYFSSDEQLFGYIPQPREKLEQKFVQI